MRPRIFWDPLPIPLESAEHTLGNTLFQTLNTVLLKGNWPSVRPPSTYETTIDMGTRSCFEFRTHNINVRAVQEMFLNRSDVFYVIFFYIVKITNFSYNTGNWKHIEVY
jgi:hypothetical protein